MTPTQTGRPGDAPPAAEDERQAREPSLGLDRRVHEPLRLGILIELATSEALTFVELRVRLKTTDGNLSVHARKLEDAGFVEYRKGFDGRMPRTEYRLTRAGRLALERYFGQMEALITATRRSATPP
jgi:DNA-binding MarR family transcriptional regulator